MAWLGCDGLKRTGRHGTRLRQVIDFQKTLEKLRAEDLVSALAQVFCRSDLNRFAAIVREGEAYFGMRQRIVRYQIGQVVTLRGFGTQNLPPRWRVEKEIARRDRRTAWMRCIFHVTHATAFDPHARSRRHIFSSRYKLNSRDRTNRCDRRA